MERKAPRSRASKVSSTEAQQVGRTGNIPSQRCKQEGQASRGYRSGKWVQRTGTSLPSAYLLTEEKLCSKLPKQSIGRQKTYPVIQIPHNVMTYVIFLRKWQS